MISNSASMYKYIRRHKGKVVNLRRRRNKFLEAYPMKNSVAILKIYIYVKYFELNFLKGTPL